jgi:hypothetical protein
VTRFAALALAAITLLALSAAPALAKKPKPKLGHTVVVMATDGHPTVKPPHKKKTKLKRGKAIAIPVGSTVDTTSGHVKLTSAKKYGGTQSGEFSQGAFVVTQGKSDDLTDLTLKGGSLDQCKPGSAKPLSAVGPSVSAAAYKHGRRLFGRAHGHFRTRGRNSSATVRGTEWLTEDGCTGTVTKNVSPNTTSKISTTGQEGLTFDLDPGQTITYYCNKLNLDPDMYCLILLAEPDQGIIAGGILTQIDVPTYRFCVIAPDGALGCEDQDLPLTDRDEHGFRQAVFACPVRQVGNFQFGWSLDHLQTFLYPTLALNLNVEGPNENCQTIPATATPIAKLAAR